MNAPTNCKQEFETPLQSAVDGQEWLSGLLPLQIIGLFLYVTFLYYGLSLDVPNFRKRH